MADRRVIHRVRQFVAYIAICACGLRTGGPNVTALDANVTCKKCKREKRNG